MNFSRPRQIIPGLAVCVSVAGAAYVLAHIEHSLFGAGFLEPLVFAIILGIICRTMFSHKCSWRPGIHFSSKTLLEIAIVLLGASISFATIKSAGLTLIVSVVAIVTLSIYVSFAVARLLRLPPRLAMLIACGNSICGNSAIVAVAPVIEANSDEVASALSFTAVLGVASVLLLPLLYTHAGMGAAQYGALAGLTVYAVPQVLAAATPAGLVAVQTGTVIKLLRVLMLGPVIFTLGILQGRAARRAGRTSSCRHLVPWFIIGFMVVVVIRSLGFIPLNVVSILLTVSSGLTVVAMAGLGLSVDIRTVANAGGRVILASTISLLLLIAVSYFVVIAALHP
ncbi:YeiH family putative sulfate export transporter [Agrobacterium rubi]|uniref:YeiH family protein n=1 Tax=Agrobacterium rubi TaxID=28099 RepID=UPI001574A74D|nr:YeiH family protein [Agrobacterium rubi]NTF09055.1 YeiH family putative sulfate export transporter [Agrobacterium rubi]NTF21326.1 YeiH family putative sulfate export transporter [Agrobacterium rubi]NTF28183.1 YeiH family putative sulfate export transporter [Agrobacterium rubi]